MIHFAGYQKPWDVVDCDFAEYFWEYAKESVYYPRLLRRIKRCFEDEANTPAAAPVMERMEQELQLLELRNKMLLEELARANVQSGFLDPLPEPEKQEESGEGPSC